MAENNTQQQTQGTSVMVSNHENSITTSDMFDSNRAKSAMMVATQISTSSLIPEHYQRRPDNVMVAMYRSARLGMDLFAYMETTYPVKGRLGHEAKFVVSLINKSGKFKTPLLYEMTGEIFYDSNGLVKKDSTRKCRAYAILKDIDKEISQEVDIQMAFREGWATKPGQDKTLKSNKWHTMTDVMLQYRAAKFFGNMFCPELVMGLNTRDELDDIPDAEVIEETEKGKDIFEKGEEVSTAAEPVLDPAMEVKQKPEAETPIETTQVSIPVTETPTKPKPEPVKIDPSEIPPTDPAEFSKWFTTKFESEASTVDAFLVAAGWLRSGECFPAMTASKVKTMRSMWNKFVSAYEKFRRDAK